MPYEHSLTTTASVAKILAARHVGHNMLNQSPSSLWSSGSIQLQFSQCESIQTRMNGSFKFLIVPFIGGENAIFLQSPLLDYREPGTTKINLN